MNPLDEYMQTRKEAGILDSIAGMVGKKQPGMLERAAGFLGSDAAKGPLGMAAMGGAVLGGVTAVRKIQQAVTRADDFRNMMQLNPDLTTERQNNPRFFVAAFNSLRRLNPTFGNDPVVSGAFMRKMMMNPDSAGLTLAQIVPPSIKKKMGPFEYT